jgi:hypothetical protein
LPTPADPIHPDQLDGDQRFRADLAAYLDSLPVSELAELLGELPSTRQQPLGLGVLMIALNERMSNAYLDEQNASETLLPSYVRRGVVRRENDGCQAASKRR